MTDTDMGMDGMRQVLPLFAYLLLCGVWCASVGEWVIWCVGRWTSRPAVLVGWVVEPGLGPGPDHPEQEEQSD